MSSHEELRSGAMNDPDDWAVAGPSFGEAGLPPGMAARIADKIMANPHATDAYVDDGTVPQGPRRNRHLDGVGYGEGK
jgi:hypothetical protein